MISSLGLIDKNFEGCVKTIIESIIFLRQPQNFTIKSIAYHACASHRQQMINNGVKGIAYI